jgi:hypothetical protein
MMIPADIQDYSKGRTKARAYFCYLFSKNIPDRLPSLSPEMIMPRLLKIKADLENCDAVYLLDHRGIQISPTYLQHSQIDEDVGKIRADRAYYYRAVRERRCSVTDPYPSLLSSELTVTASKPIFDEYGEIKYVACLDLPFGEALKITHFNTLDTFFSSFFKISYAVFAVALIAIASLLFIKGIQSFFDNELSMGNFDIKNVFEATILLTLSLAMFDLTKTIIEEEITGQNQEHDISGPHKTMVKFLGSIIIALSIEALMLVFKFAITDPGKLVYAIYIMGGVAAMIMSLAVYLKFTKEKTIQ